MSNPPRITQNVRLDLLSTLKAGGRAEHFCNPVSRDDLAAAAIFAQTQSLTATILGWGSNVLPADQGVPGLVIHNRSHQVHINSSGQVEVDSGTAFQDLFLKTAQAGLGGFEFAVGIPGTVGGALVSNAGAYRNNISAFLTEVEVVEKGHREWRTPDFLQLSYRDSILRRTPIPQIVILALRFDLAPRNRKLIFDDARDYQRQRIGKQPPSASAGSFFKNVVDPNLSQVIEGLTPGMREAGVIPAGFLIEQCRLKGARYGGAMIGRRHANFLLNVGGATATELRHLAEYAAAAVQNHFNVQLEEEALYLGDWSDWVNQGTNLNISNK